MKKILMILGVSIIASMCITTFAANAKMMTVHVQLKKLNPMFKVYPIFTGQIANTSSSVSVSVTRYSFGISSTTTIPKGDLGKYTVYMSEGDSGFVQYLDKWKNGCDFTYKIYTTAKTPYVLFGSSAINDATCSVDTNGTLTIKP